MHCARHRVELGIMRARRFAEARRGRRKLVPEAIEIDTLSAGHQPLHVRPAEAKVPEQRVFEDLLPRSDSGQRRVDENETRDSVGILRRKSIADHVADIMRDEVGAVDFQLIKYACHIAGLRLLVKASGGLGGEAHSSQVRHHYGMIARKVGCHGRPHVTRLTITVKQHDGGPGAAGAHIYRSAVGRYIMCAEFWRKVESVHDDLHVARSAPTDKVEPRVQGSGLTLLCQKAEKW